MGDETGALPILICRLGCVGGDINAIIQSGEAPLYDIGRVEWYDPKGDICLPLGEAEQARACQYLDVDAGIVLW